jgi:hypothetical protein
MSYSPHAKCQFITGEPVNYVWEYCLKPTVTVVGRDGTSRSSYCAEHHRRCYRRLTPHTAETSTDWLVSKIAVPIPVPEPMEQAAAE